MRLVIDTNVVASAFLAANSIASQAFDRAQQDGDLLTSVETAEELTKVLSRRKFDRFVPRRVRGELLESYLRSSMRIEVTEQVFACRDPHDDKFLSLGISGHADVIMTGDADLLTLHPFRNVAILSPSAYLAL